MEWILTPPSAAQREERLTLILAARAKNYFQTCKDSHRSCVNTYKYENICNPSLMYVHHFVVSIFLAKTSSVTFSGLEK